MLMFYWLSSNRTRRPDGGFRDGGIEEGGIGEGDLGKLSMKGLFFV
jgi:hypothetical protein